MISLVNISKKYDSKTLLENFSLEIKRGEKVLIDAPSGKGKTTLIKLLMGFERPDSGKIVFDGMDLCRENLKTVRSRIGYVSQNVDFMETDVKEMIDAVFAYKVNAGAYPQQSSVISLLTRYRLDRDILEKNIKDLSGGERQRVGLIVCMLLNRPVWLLDEVTASLDSELKEIVAQDVLDSDATVVIISHDKYWQKSKNIKVVRL